MEKALFLKDLSTGCVDALIIYEASSEEDACHIEHVISQETFDCMENFYKQFKKI